MGQNANILVLYSQVGAQSVGNSELSSFINSVDLPFLIKKNTFKAMGLMTNSMQLPLCQVGAVAQKGKFSEPVPLSITDQLLFALFIFTNFYVRKNIISCYQKIFSKSNFKNNFKRFTLYLDFSYKNIKQFLNLSIINLASNFQMKKAYYVYKLQRKALVSRLSLNRHNFLILNANSNRKTDSKSKESIYSPKIFI
ncbi:hypothetical protein BpHYR1_000031 [Brachionus plicatilis]|uniref:Uncharacterized protein n=1 Tax=Brachionus plicatilis TaxID=10195 RepID=A0A3M7QK50_BRAPC|nr:hypothetical protein BpHYR1_000031 [Brachionus plicatilis]